MNLLNNQTKLKNPNRFIDIFMGFMLVMALCFLALASTMTFAQAAENCEIGSLPSDTAKRVRDRAKVIQVGDKKVTLVTQEPSSDGRKKVLLMHAERVKEAAADPKQKASDAVADLKMSVRGATRHLPDYEADMDFIRQRLQGSQEDITIGLFANEQEAVTNYSNSVRDRKRIRDLLKGLEDLVPPNKVNKVLLSHSGPAIVAKDKAPSRVKWLYLERSHGRLEKLRARYDELHRYFSGTPMNRLVALHYSIIDAYSKELDKAYHHPDQDVIFYFDNSKLVKRFEEQLGRSLNKGEREYISAEAESRHLFYRIQRILDEQAGGQLITSKGDVVAFVSASRFDSVLRVAEGVCRQMFELGLANSGHATATSQSAQ